MNRKIKRQIKRLSPELQKKLVDLLEDKEVPSEEPDMTIVARDFDFRQSDYYLIFNAFGNDYFYSINVINSNVDKDKEGSIVKRKVMEEVSKKYFLSKLVAFGNEFKIKQPYDDEITFSLGEKDLLTLYEVEDDIDFEILLNFKKDDRKLIVEEINNILDHILDLMEDGNVTLEEFKRSLSVMGEREKESGII